MHTDMHMNIQVNTRVRIGLHQCLHA